MPGCIWPPLPKPSIFHTWPPPWACIPASATRLASNTPPRFTSTMRLRIAGSVSQSGLRGALMPALLIHTSTRPKRLAASSQSACNCSTSVISQALPATRALSCCAASSATTASTAAGCLPLIMTLQPRDRKFSASPRPIPRVLPVMTTVFMVLPLISRGEFACCPIHTARLLSFPWRHYLYY